MPSLLWAEFAELSLNRFWNSRDFLAVLFTFLEELQLWFVNLQPMIKVMLILVFLSVSVYRFIFTPGQLDPGGQDTHGQLDPPPRG